MTNPENQAPEENKPDQVNNQVPPENPIPKTEAPKKEMPKKESNPDHKGFFAFVSDNLWESISYVIMFAGLILSIFNPFIGGSLVGIILGIYFSQEVIDRAMSFKDLIIKEGIFRGFIVIAAVLALFILAPGLVLGVIIGAWIRPFLGNSISSPFDKE
ncbi:MAG: hypothetical protein LLF94_07490 [Chlamydiales bacterium]|nr:hypothetical protein [Chlamydiales bacterium]